MTNLPYRTDAMGEAGWVFFTVPTCMVGTWQTFRYSTKNTNQPHPSLWYGKLVISFQFAKHLSTEIRAQGIPYIWH